MPYTIMHEIQDPYNFFKTKKVRIKKDVPSKGQTIYIRKIDSK